MASASHNSSCLLSSAPASRDASTADVQQAHDRLARELAPDAIDSALATELGEKLDAIREVVGEALRVLADETLRPRYTKHLS